MKHMKKRKHRRIRSLGMTRGEIRGETRGNAEYETGMRGESDEGRIWRYEGRENLRYILRTERRNPNKTSGRM